MSTSLIAAFSSFAPEDCQTRHTGYSLKLESSVQNLLASAGAPRFVSFVGWIFLLPLAAVDASAIAPVRANIQRLRLFRIFVGVFLLLFLEVDYIIIKDISCP